MSPIQQRPAITRVTVETTYDGRHVHNLVTEYDPYKKEGGHVFLVVVDGDGEHKYNTRHVRRVHVES